MRYEKNAAEFSLENGQSFQDYMEAAVTSWTLYAAKMAVKEVIIT